MPPCWETASFRHYLPSVLGWPVLPKTLQAPGRTGKLTSASRPCDLRKNLEGDGTQKAVAKQAEATQADDGRRVGSLPFSEYVRFETEQGGVLLYEPSALDRWIGMSIRQDRTAGDYINNVTGWPLNELLLYFPVTSAGGGNKATICEKLVKVP